jgi:hypothetical protein
MMLGKQKQKAGTHASQIQVAGDLVVQEGVTEDRASAIAYDAARQVLAEYSEEAREIGMARISAFDGTLVIRLAASNLLDAFRDPAFQVLLRKAQIGAASSEREKDYDLLAGLLADRAARAGNRPIISGISRAVEVVDQLDDDALLGLTAMSALIQYSPLAGSVGAGLDTMDSLFGELIRGDELPEGNEWLDHLDVLGAIRMDPVQKFHKFEQFFPSKTPGYLARGVAIDSDEQDRAREELSAVQILNLDVDHELKPGYRRLPFPTSAVLETALLAASPARADQLEVALRIAKDIYGIDAVDPSVTPAFMDELRKRENLQRLELWWNGFPTHFIVTAVGRVLARANAYRLDERRILPPID